MKRFLIGAILVFAALAIPVTSEAYYVNSYSKSNGSYVSGYYRSRPNAYTYDNYTYSSPSYSNGYGYNKSYYYPTKSYSSTYYTPSYSDSDYSYGYYYNYGY